MYDRDAAMARTIAEAVDRAGGRTFFVGGWVRDRLMGQEGKDVDIEVHGIPVPDLEAILDGLGERLAMGASFGILGLRHYGVDISVPRSDRAEARDQADPYVGPERAARRRDLTINAMMEDVLTGEVLDFFGGRRDLAERCIRHVDDQTFAEDPLRVFRVAQFAARFGFSVAPETAALCAGLQVSSLACERVFGELEKALLKTKRPSAFFQILREMGQLSDWFPEVLAGDWERFQARLDRAAVLRDRASDPLGFMLAALCGNMDDGPAQGPRAKEFLGRLIQDVRLTRYALDSSARQRALFSALKGKKEEMALLEALDGSPCPEDLPLLVRAAEESLSPEEECRLDEALDLYRTRMARPFVMGRDLVAAGVSPGKRMGLGLACAHQLRLAGRSKEEQLKETLRYLEGESRGEGD